MMKLLRDLSIKHKLVLILVFTSGLSLAIASAAFVGYDVAAYKRSFVRELEAQAHIIAYNSAAALTFDDYDSAAETIGALQKESRVVGAYLLSPEGQVFAQYERADVAGHFPRPRVDRDGAFFVEDRLVVRAPVEFDGDTIGHVYIEADLRELDERVSGYVGLATSIVASVLIVVFLASSRLQNVISEPILRLASTARLISREKDYGVRAAKFGDDEVGALIDGFNDMLTEIQTRDRELAQHRDRLEEAVVRRTAELWEVNERLRDSEERLRTIVEGTSSATGAEFFDALVTTLARALGTRWVMVGAVQDSRESVRVQAMWDGERVVKDQEYALAGTPCEHVLEDSFCLYEDGVAKVFPRDHLLSDWGVRSYVGVLLRDSDGAPIGILNAFHDDKLSDAAREGSLLRVFASRAAAELERLRVEVELLESESRTRAILESAADGIVTIDEAGHIESMNRAAEEMFGCGAGALLGQHVAACMSFTDGDSRAARLGSDAAGVLSEFVGGRGELTGLRADGRVFPMNIAVGTMRAGGRNGFTAIVRDITRERELEQMKSDFVSTVSHEIRTPLAAIISSAKILLRGGGETKPGVTAKFSSIIVEEGKRLTRLINDLLDLSKMDARKIDWTVKEAKPADIIQHVKDLAEGDAIAKKLSISVELEARIPSVYVDPDKVVQVLTNLVNNAIKFTPEGGQIRITAHAREEGFVRIGVRDTGIGIAPEHRGVVFERFKQIGNVLTDRPQGTGLGLPICKQIVEYLGGRIWVDSELGKGSTFWFTVPVANVPAELGSAQRDVAEETLTEDASAETEATRAEAARAEAAHAEAARAEAARAEAARAEAAHAEAARAEAARAEAARADAARAEAARVETARIEAARAEAARLEAARVEAERAEAERVETARAEARRAEETLSGETRAEETVSEPTPVAEPVVAETPGAETLADGEPLEKAVAAKPIILVVEDDAATQEILRFTLEARSFDVVTAATVDEALRLAREHRPALITLDIVMPDGTGFDVLRAVRADSELARTPVVLLSVMADETHGERALKLGANAYLTKPCDAGVLVRTVEGLVARGRRDVLIISDEAVDNAYLKTSLREQGYQVVEALDAQSGLTFARRYPPDLILLQTAASNRQTQEILAELRGDRATESVPVVLLAGDAIADGGSVYLGGWSETLRSDSMGISELLSSLVERFATRTDAVTLDEAHAEERSADLS